MASGFQVIIFIPAASHGAANSHNESWKSSFELIRGVASSAKGMTLKSSPAHFVPGASLNVLFIKNYEQTNGSTGGVQHSVQTVISLVLRSSSYSRRVSGTGVLVLNLIIFSVADIYPDCIQEGKSHAPRGLPSVHHLVLGLSP